ncbi:MAG: hypothetical protein ABI853_06400 [Sphingomicrobium sp.]
MVFNIIEQSGLASRCGSGSMHRVNTRPALKALYVFDRVTILLAPLGPFGARRADFLGRQARADLRHVLANLLVRIGWRPHFVTVDLAGLSGERS